VFLVSASFSVGKLDDNLNVNHDHETEYQNELLQPLDFDLPDQIIENSFDSNYIEDQGPVVDSNMFEEVDSIPFDDDMSMRFDDTFLDDINTPKTFQGSLEPMNDKQVREPNALLDEQDVLQDIWQDLMEESSDDQMNLDPTSLQKFVLEFESELGISSGTKEIQLNKENSQKTIDLFLEKLKKVLLKIKKKSLTKKLQDIIDNYNTLQSNPSEQNYFERFSNSIQDYLLNEPTNQINYGINLIKEYTNSHNNDLIMNRILSIEEDLRISLNYYENVLKIVSQINRVIKQSDSRMDLNEIQSDIMKINDINYNKLMDEIIRKISTKVHEISRVIKKHEKNGEENMTETVKASTSTSKRRRSSLYRKQKTDKEMNENNIKFDHENIEKTGKGQINSNPNSQEETHTFLDELKDIMNKIKTKSIAMKLQDIIDDYNTLQSNPSEQNYFERFSNSIQEYLKNEVSYDIKQGLELIKEYTNSHNNDLIMKRVLAIEKDLRISLNYHENVLKIVSQINEVIKQSDSRMDLSEIQSNIMKINDVNYNKLMDEIIRKLWLKVYNIYITVKKHEEKQETNGASTSTTSLKRKRKTDHEQNELGIKIYSFLNELKEIMNNLKPKLMTKKLQDIIDDYNTMQSNPSEQNYFEGFSNSIQGYISNDKSDRIKQGIELIRQNVNLPENDKIKIRLNSVEKDLETWLKYYDDILQIVSQINQRIQNDSKIDLNLIHSDITKISGLLNNQSMDELKIKALQKVYNIYGVKRRNGKMI